LPVCTIIVALYREAKAVQGLLASLDALDWPPEKLDIKFVLERDDYETRAALQAIPLHRPYDVLVAPDIGRRTKPKALNVALPFARGAFVTVFDAEDRPEPDQLRRAYETFLADDDRLACVQARLTIDNTRDGWLTAMFTAEYAGLFDVLLPALARNNLPLPLGGSSNHFRTAALRAAGGWDPHNLTEDADLGMRLARLGYRSTVIVSSTYEEAPSRLSPWLRQRRRWFQGWMQTWLVHMRAPARALRELGPSGFVTLQLVVGGTVLAALIHPLFLAAFALDAVSGGLLDEQGLAGMLMGALSGTTFASGYLTSVILGAIGLARRRLMSSAWVLLLVPVHWLLLSLAAWQAAIKLVRDPYRWDKTEHGDACTSRLAQRACSDATPQPQAGHIAAGNIRLSSAATRSA
jgi:cellulose synthase/poly-beta-1,6-N-acetylglucosamine synthase-like glycosyltransferase